ncbi:EAL domain-containing protein [Clostridium sp. MCC353]|nr:GGDEF domain-containing protein [Clostridium sp. MCC353]MBT9775642.1 EAL domain-containing protein [Clostridium sp. MCC353]
MRGRHKNWGYMVIPLILCLCFITSSVIFLLHMIKKNEKENLEYLYNAAGQNRTTIWKQIQGDYETLAALAVSLGDSGVTDAERILHILKKINKDNSFIQMGFADTEGNLTLVDMEGEVFHADLRGKEFFENALNGAPSISEAIDGQVGSDNYVNYYGIQMRNLEEEIIGVLIAVHDSSIYRRIIDAPLLNNQGYSCILNEEGDIVLCPEFLISGVGEGENLKDILRQISEEFSESVASIILSGGTGEFFFNDRAGKKQAVLTPLIDGQWYLLSAVPVNALRARYVETAVGMIVIISAACCLFVLFGLQQRYMMVKNQKVLLNLAYDDQLTGLRNFDGFKLDAAAVLKKYDVSDLLIWYADLKRFKFINDMLGYEEGDRILKRIAHYFSSVQSECFITGRISADNFVGICRDKGDHYIERGMGLILEYLKQGGDEGQPFIEASVGIYRLKAGDEKVSIDVLTNYANMAKKEAKKLAGSNCFYYNEEVRKRALEDSALEAEGKNALQTGEFKVYMQPKINIQNGNRLAGAEALVRWQNARRGMIPPDRFISLFEKSEMIIHLDRYMFEQTCKWLKRYLDQGGSRINIAVNVSKVGLLQADFIEYYSNIKNKYGIPDGCMELEFTESVLSTDTDVFENVVLNLQKNGFICSLDDFGSGYSSLNLLKNLPINVLKLDIMFFRQTKDIHRERVVISNFIHMARELGIKTIAEGVEQTDSVEFLREAGCDIIQGYVFAKPMPVEEFERLAWKMEGKAFEVEGEIGI